MTDRELRDAARAVERSVVPPDFGDVVTRGHEIRARHRRRVGALSVAAVALVGVAVAVPWVRLAPAQDPAPADPPRPTDGQRTALLLSDPAALVDEDALLVSDQGAVLQRVHVPSPAGGRCDADRRSALVWHDWDGDRRAWSSAVVGRAVVAVPTGFAIGAVPPACARVLGDSATERGAYVVDASGDTEDITWEGDAEQRCAVAPGTPGCEIDAGTGSGRFVDGARDTPGPAYVGVGDASGWAASTDGTRLAWSRDGGRTWQEHRTVLVADPGDTVQSTAAGDVAVFFAWPQAEVTRDHGATWEVVDLEDALAPVLVANPVLHVTADGLLAGVSYPTAGRPFVFVSTDPSWTRFERSDFRTARGDFDLGVSGAWLWTHDQGSTWVSRDALEWRHVVPLISSGSR